MERANYRVTATLTPTDTGWEIVRLEPGDTTGRLFGLALDLGSTTLEMTLLDLNSGAVLARAQGGNSQTAIGADILTRITYAKDRPDHLAELQAMAAADGNALLERCCREAGVDPEEIAAMTVGGNTTMIHFLLGCDPWQVFQNPYTPVFYDPGIRSAAELGLHLRCNVVCLPAVANYVGGDITAGALVSMIWNRPEMSLFIDLGTNGELAFGNSDFMVSCACSAGPAFEGGDISCGMRATDGAIEKCTIDPETMEPSYHVIGDEGTKPIGLCGSGIIDVSAALFRAKMVNPKGKFIREGRRIRHDKYGMGSYVIAFEEEAGSVRDVEITEVDIDNFIRAKGAIFSAIRTMLNYLDMDVSMIEEVYVAGGIGSGINMKNAVTIGMFPDIPLEKFHYIGNSSLTGAYSMLLSTAAEKKTYEVARNMTYLELSTVPTYMDEFVAACFLPHTDTTMFPSVEA